MKSCGADSYQFFCTESEGVLVEELNKWGSILMAVALIAVFIGVIVTIVGLVMFKQGATSSLKFNPKSVLVALWGAVVIVSIPGLIAFGSTFMPAPAKSTATRVDPAYLESKADTQRKTNASKDEIIKFIGQDTYEQNKDKIERVSNPYAKPTILFQPASAQDNGTPDQCTKVRVQVWRGANQYSGFDTLEFAPANYDEASCGGLQEFPAEEGK